MANLNTPFGFRAIRHINNSDFSYNQYTIASGYAANIFTGDAVVLSSGTIQKAAGADTTASTTIQGIFAGCQYNLPGSNKPQFSSYWPSGQVATNIIAYVYDDPGIVYAVQCDSTAVTQSVVGSQFDFYTGTGSTTYGQSGDYLYAAGTTGATKGWRVLAVSNDGVNVLGAYAVLEVNLFNSYQRG